MLVTFIGGGNMATALISGLARRGPITDSVRVCDPDSGVRERLAGEVRAPIHGVMGLDEVRRGHELLETGGVVGSLLFGPSWI